MPHLCRLARRSRLYTASLVVPHLGDGGIASFLTGTERLAQLGFARHLHAPSCFGQAELARAVNIALVRTHLARRVRGIEQPKFRN